MVKCVGRERWTVMGIEWRLAPRIEVEHRLCLGEIFQLEKEHNEFITKETMTGFADRTPSSTYLDEMTVNGNVSPTDEEPIVRDLDQ